MTIASFMHVSEARYLEDTAGLAGVMPVDGIPLPKRATAGSAGYDFVSPADVTIAPGAAALIPTGIRARMEPGWVLILFPRSSLGFKYGIRLCNTAGIIDSDYFSAKNEGHILVKLKNDGDTPVTIAKGDRFCQGLFLPYGTAEEDNNFAQRTGGIGSTGVQ